MDCIQLGITSKTMNSYTRTEFDHLYIRALVDCGKLLQLYSPLVRYDYIIPQLKVVHLYPLNAL